VFLEIIHLNWWSLLESFQISVNLWIMPLIMNYFKYNMQKFVKCKVCENFTRDETSI